MSVGGCGNDPPPPPPSVPTGPPGKIESTITDGNSFPVRKLEIRLLQSPPAGTLSEGGDFTGVSTANVRDQKEGPDMKLIQRTETNDFGKFKLENVAPGEYLLSAGTLTTGIWRQWITMEPGKTLNPAIKLPGRK